MHIGTEPKRRAVRRQQGIFRVGARAEAHTGEEAFAVGIRFTQTKATDLWSNPHALDDAERVGQVRAATCPTDSAQFSAASAATGNSVISASFVS